MQVLPEALSGNYFDPHFVDPETEREFIAANDMSCVKANRAGILLSMVGWMAFTGTVILFNPNALRISLFAIVPLYPLFGILLFLFSRKELVHLYQASCAIANGLAALVEILVFFFFVRNPMLGTTFIMILLIFAFFILRLRLKIALITTASYLVVFNVSTIASGLFDMKSLLFFSMGWIGEFCMLVGGNQLEMANRRLFGEQRSRNRLLLSILPPTVAQELQQNGQSRPVQIESSTILFSDFVHFTQATKGIEPISVVALLNRYFTFFDALAGKYNVERLKTIGDGYMCAGGIPDKNATHPIDACLMALEMLGYVETEMKQRIDAAWSIRIGINTGSVTAGIIGNRKFSYDIWGEAVNIASRHESSGVEGGINVSKGTYLLTKSFFDFEARGRIEIKGGEKLEMFRLDSLKEEFRSSGGPNRNFIDIYSRIQKGELMLGFDI